MGKIAFVFSGQGDQFPGMGKDLYEKYPAARKIYDLCDGIRPGTSAQCFHGTEDELKETKNTQPCLFAMELAAANVLMENLMEKGLAPGAAAGFSLGEVTAAVVSGAFDNETGFRLVCKRGELMQKEAEKFDTFMAAVVKLTPGQVQEVCEKYPDVYPVNFNCPGQITVSGLTSQMKDFTADVRAAGGRAIPLKVKGAFHSPFMQMKDFTADVRAAGGRAIPLKVKGAFHSPFMKEAAEAFAGELANVKVNKPGLPLYSNRTGKPYEDDVAGLLSSQICSPVQWEKIIRNMIAAGVDTFIEIGPGKTLTNMIRKISKDVKAVTVTEYLADYPAEVKGC